MQFYNNMNTQNNYNYQLFEAQKLEKKALWTNASKLGALLLIYNLLSSVFLYVYYYGVYIYKNHSFTISWYAVRKYLASQTDMISSTTFSMLGNTIIVFCSLLCTMLAARFIMNVDFSQMLKPHKGHGKQAVKWLPVCMSFNFIASFAISFFTVFMNNMGVTVPETDLSIHNPTAAAVIIQIFYVVILGPIAEEMIYRGLILTLLKPFGKWMAVIVSALFFGLMHGNVSQAAAGIAGALIFGLVAIHCNSIVPTIIIHILNNMIVTYSDLCNAFDWPLSVYYGLMIIIFLVGVYFIFTKLWQLKIRDDKCYALSPARRYLTVFTNIFIVIYVLYLLSIFIKSFYFANM